jgi:sugar/nucleoside kinase (ribokinase family)
VGDCGVDHYEPSGERHFGGITANFARHANDAFPDDVIRIVSCIGDDDGAEIVRSALLGSGIDCLLTELSGQTPVQYIEIDADGEKHFVRYDEGVLRDFRFSDEQKNAIKNSELMVAPVYLQIVDLFDELMSIETLGQVSIDFADFLQHPDFELLERHIESIDVGFFGLTGGDSEAMRRLRQLAARHQKLFIVTLGKEGSVAYHNGDFIEHPAIDVDAVIDTTGAGDAYAAGFLSRFCHGASIQEAMNCGAKRAADVIGRVGSYHQAR